MMVTLETAAIVGVEKRLNPEQNIKGGAKYLAMLPRKNIYWSYQPLINYLQH